MASPLVVSDETGQSLLQYQPGAILTVMVTDEDANDDADPANGHMAVVQRPEQHGPVDQD